MCSVTKTVKPQGIRQGEAANGETGRAFTCPASRRAMSRERTIPTGGRMMPVP